MEPIEIIVIICAALIVFGVFLNYLYRKIKHKPVGECAYCHSDKKGSRLVKAYHKKYKNN